MDVEDSLVWSHRSGSMIPDCKLQMSESTEARRGETRFLARAIEIEQAVAGPQSPEEVLPDGPNGSGAAFEFSPSVCGTLSSQDFALPPAPARFVY